MIAKANPEPKSTKAEPASQRTRFVDLVEVRAPKVLKQINMVGNLSVKGRYEYSEEGVSKIYDAITEAANQMKAPVGAFEKFVFGYLQHVMRKHFV